MTADKHPPIRSYVRREGRQTKGQQRALNDLWEIYGINNENSLLDIGKEFNRVAPLVLEVGFGNGQSLAQMASDNPEINYIGIEVHRPGVGSLLLLIEDLGLKNVRIICDDAVDVIKNRLPENSLDEVQLFFPDPWHKKRHHKRRIVQPAFVSLIAKKLKDNGLLHLATDWEDYAIHMVEVMGQSTRFKNTAKDGIFISRPNSRPLTKFEQRGKRLGHGVWDLIYKRK